MGRDPGDLSPAPQHLMVSSLSGKSSGSWLVLGVRAHTQLPCLMQSVGIRMIFTEELGSIIEICCIITGIATAFQCNRQCSFEDLELPGQPTSVSEL